MLEFFLHHEEQFHSTPETQTDESYNHAEDLEHFAHHERIEREEAEREAKYQGITVDEALAQHEPHEHDEPKQPEAHQQQEQEQVILNPHDDQHNDEPAAEPFKDPVERLRGAAKAASSAKTTEEFAGSEGAFRPRNPTDRRKNAPYKVLFLLPISVIRGPKLMFRIACSTSSAVLGATSNLFSFRLHLS